MARNVRQPATHLTVSGHGIYYMRVPIPRTSGGHGRKYLQLFLGTSDPDKAGRLSRLLLIETKAFMEQINQAVVDRDGVPIPYEALKARIETHYRAALETVKAKRNLAGPSQ